MKFLLLVLAVLATLSYAKKIPTKDLDPNADLRIGVTHRPKTCSEKSKAGDKLTMHYTGTTYVGGKKFDSSLDRGDPFVFELGAGQVIKGWDYGLSNMCIGEKRKLTIPSELGYGDRGAGSDIKAGATLVFTVELLGITSAPGKNIDL